MAEIESAEPATARSHPRKSARNRYNGTMRMVRRAHLYAGLFMVPWVFLYGATALLFNHPGVFPDQEMRTISPSDVGGTPLADFPAPRVLAGRVVAAVNAAGEAGGSGEAYRLVRPEEAAFVREYSTTLTDGKSEHSVRIDLATRSGTVRTAPKREQRGRDSAAPFAVRGGFRLDPPPLEAVTQAMPLILARIGLPAEGLSVAPGLEGGRGVRPESGPRAGPVSRPDSTGGPDSRGGSRAGGRPGVPSSAGRSGEGPPGDSRAGSAGPPAPAAGPDGPEGARRKGQGGSPDGGAGGRPGQAVGMDAPPGRLGGPELAFLMEGRGKTWRVGYNLQTGALTGRPAESPPGEPLSTRRFLLRLHLTHGYPSRFDARWFWAVAVDLMFVSMVGWGLTGLLMWWQMKNVRRVGAIVLALGVAASLAAAIGMHGLLTGGP